MSASSSPTRSTKHRDSADCHSTLSLQSIFVRFKWRISLTLSLVVVETLLDLLYPLFIGWAINDLLNGTYDGIIMLLGLGIVTILMGSARRFYDTRIYAGIYRSITPEMVVKEKARNQGTSTIAARCALLTEFVEFLENSMPEVIAALFGLAGGLLLIGTLNLNVFLACTALLVLVTLIYWVTGNLNYRLNAGYNTELEKQVAAVEQSDGDILKTHLRRLMRWNIRLSDLETVNYFFIWIGVIALFLYTPIAAIENEAANYGLIFSLLMYVFDYIDKVVRLPLYVQQVIRLSEISNRLNA